MVQAAGRVAVPFPRERLALATDVAVVGAAVVIWILATQYKLGVGVYWAIGVAFGIIVQRSRLCFAGAFRDLVLSNDGRLMRSIIAGLAVATVGFSLLMARFVPNTSFGVLPPMAHVLPVGVSTLVGGVLFGVGMVLAGGCVSGTLWRMGEGYLNSWVAMGGILVGLWVSARTWNWWWRHDLQHRDATWLPNELGHAGSVVLVLAALGVLYIAVLWWESRSPRLDFPAVAAPPSAPSTVLDHLRASWRAVFRGHGWPYVAGGLSLAALNVFSYDFEHPLGVTGELGTWSDRVADKLGVAAGSLSGTEALSGCNLVQGGSWLTSSTTITFGLLFGAFVSAVLSREFKVRWSRQRARYPQLVAGGLLMGYGAGIGVGCTIGAFFSAIPSLALSGWVFAAGLLAGAFVGVQIIRRLP